MPITVPQCYREYACSLAEDRLSLEGAACPRRWVPVPDYG